MKTFVCDKCGATGQAIEPVTGPKDWRTLRITFTPSGTFSQTSVAKDLCAVCVKELATKLKCPDPEVPHQQYARDKLWEVIEEMVEDAVDGRMSQ